MGISVSIKYNNKMFDGLDIKACRKHLKNYIKDVCSGTSGNPLYEHYGQVQSVSNDFEYFNYKKNKYGSTKVFKETGEAEKLIKAKSGRNKKFTVAYRKKKQYFFMGATIRKPVDGNKNAYNYAQRGKFKGIEAKVDGKDSFVKKDDYLKSMKDANEAWKQLIESGEDVGRTKVKAFKAKLISKKYGFDKGTAKGRKSKERLITANKNGDERFISQSEMNGYIEKIIKDSGYKLK